MDIPAILAVILIFGGIPLSAIWTHHKRKMLELQLRLRNQADAGVQASVEALRQEVRALRETSTQYDLSFDAALQRMESRMENVERRVQAVEAGKTTDLSIGR
jgi:hypothetical protein